MSKYEIIISKNFANYPVGEFCGFFTVQETQCYFDLGGSEISEFHPPHPNVHLPLIQDFAEAVLDGKEPKITGETGREINRIIGEIYAA